jgi:hypothetical protein
MHSRRSQPDEAAGARREPTTSPKTTIASTPRSSSSFIAAG